MFTQRRHFSAIIFAFCSVCCSKWTELANRSRKFSARFGSRFLREPLVDSRRNKCVQQQGLRVSRLSPTLFPKNLPWLFRNFPSFHDLPVYILTRKSSFDWLVGNPFCLCNAVTWMYCLELIKFDVSISSYYVGIRKTVQCCVTSKPRFKH